MKRRRRRRSKEGGAQLLFTPYLSCKRKHILVLLTT
jgi:hypothetical protein